MIVGARLCSQNDRINKNSLEIDVLAVRDETLYYGGHSKYSISFSQNQHHCAISFSLSTYFDFKGESEPKAYLKNDIDMRITPTVNI